MANASSIWNTDTSTCKRYGKLHLGKCRIKTRVCFRCGSHEHLIRECSNKVEYGLEQVSKFGTTFHRGRKLRPRNTSGASRNESCDTTFKSKIRALAKTSAIQAKEEVTTRDVITGTFTLFDVTVIVLIDLGSTHSYICTKLASKKNILVESTKFDVRVSNLIGQSVIVNKVYKNYPLKIRDYEFSVDLMLLTFDEFDVILGMDCLTIHDAVVSCK